MKKVYAVVAVLAVFATFLLAPSANAKPQNNCADPTITVVVTEAHWQRYSWTGGPHLSDDPPAFPSADWQPNTQSDPHNVGVPGAYFRSNGNSGNGDWFYLEWVDEVTDEIPNPDYPCATTTIPTTTVVDTTLPTTTVVDTTVPTTTVVDTTVPTTTVVDTTVPDTTVPDTTVPDDDCEVLNNDDDPNNDCIIPPATIVPPPPPGNDIDFVVPPPVDTLPRTGSNNIGFYLSLGVALVASGLFFKRASVAKVKA